METVRTLSKIICETERTINSKIKFDYMLKHTPTPTSTAESVAAQACQTAIDLNIDMIICFTQTGKIA